MATVDPVSVLEVAYGTFPDERAWLNDVALTMRPLLDVDRLSLHAYVARGMSERRHDLIYFGGYPKKRLLETIARPLAYPPVAPEIMGAMVRKLAFARGVASLRDVAGPAVAEFWGEGVNDSVAFICADGQGQAVVIAALTKKSLAMDAASHALWRRVAVHLGAARRLVSAPLDVESDGVESILEPDGKVVDARGRAKPKYARDQLRNAVLAIDRARARRGRADPHGALAAWTGLFAGRWSLVDRFDTDGRRFFVARPNEPESPLPPTLTRRQRQTAFYASLGWSNKEVGYALGIAPTTVSMHLRAALDRLGMSSRIELVRTTAEIAVAAFQSATHEAGSDSVAGASTPTAPDAPTANITSL